MGVPGSANALLLASAAAAAATPGRSLRFNSADSAYLSRTPASAGNRKTFTISFWIKRTNLNSYQHVAYSETPSTGANSFSFRFNMQDAGRINDELQIYAAGAEIYTSALFRDPSAWYHFVVAVDTTQATGSDRIKIYVNNSLQTSFRSASYPAQNTDLQWNNTGRHSIGSANTILYGNLQFMAGYLADIYNIDGQQLTPSSFGETDATTGQWIAKTYSGSYGTNGFFLNFADNSSLTSGSNAGIGKDTSPNGNYWNSSGLSVTAGSGNDSLRDHPTSAGTSTGAGGEVSGNYATLNPLANNGGTLSNGNYDHSGAAALTTGTLFPSSGKWYFEVTCNTYSGGVILGYTAIGVIKSDQTINTIPNSIGTVPSGLWVYRNDALKINNGASASYGNTWNAGDVIGVAFDVDAGKVWFAKNGSWQASGDPAAGTNAAYTNLSGSIGVAINDQGFYTTTYSLNTGARAFAHNAPSGFSPLVDTLLPTPTIAKPNTVMDVKLYTGNGSTQTISGLNFSPDWVWIKGRSGATDHALYDIVRGVQKDLVSNSTAAETTQTTGLTAFNSGGFDLGSLAKLNTSSATYVAWCWDAGSSNATNTSGTITSTVRANISAGFSVVTYSGNNTTNGSVGHGLGVSPSMVIIKARNASKDWKVAHVSLAAQNMLSLDQTYATNIASWDGVTSTVFKPARSGDTYNNTSGENYVAYCFAPVAGYSSFGSYTGNGSTNGPFVYTGFRSRWVMIKNASASSSWSIIDTARNTYNLANSFLLADASDAEVTPGYFRDYLSNGFKIRDNGSGVNTNGNTYIYAAFAESPFAYARAR